MNVKPILTILGLFLLLTLVACGAGDWPAAPDLSAVETVCLDIESAMSENEDEWIYNDEDIIRMLSRLDYEWVQAGGDCDATLAFTGKGKAYGGSYSKGSGANASTTYCYTGGSVKGAVILTVAGGEPVSLPIRGSKAREQTTTDCYRVPPYYLVIHEPMLDALTHFFGADFLVRNIPDRKDYIRQYAIEGLRELDADLTQAYLDCLWSPDLYAAGFCAKYMGGDAVIGTIMPTLLERLAAEKAQWRAMAAAALGHLGPDAIEAVPALIPLLADEASLSEDSRVSVYALEALQAITGQDLGAEPEAWQQWWEAQ
jgi:hypothetical protein